MVYLKRFVLPSEHAENEFLKGEGRTCFNTFYPFNIFPLKGLRELEFDTITILCGGNGSGKSTLINVMARKLNAVRFSDFNDSPFLDVFVDMCYQQYRSAVNSYVLTSDDVFDYALNARYINGNLDERRNELFEKYASVCNEIQYNPEIGRLKGLHDYDRWSETREILSKRVTQSQYIKKRVASEIDLHSNGETAMRYFLDRIDDDAVYLLDEPENSLSVERQIELAEYISATARATRSQFIIATHSPVLLSMPYARIYNLDSYPVSICKWTELPNVRKYYDFFIKHKNEFEKG